MTLEIRWFYLAWKVKIKMDTNENMQIPSNYTLRVKGGNKNESTHYVNLSKCLLKTMLANPDKFVKLQCVGPKSLYIANRAIGLACREFEAAQSGLYLIVRPSFYTAYIDDKRAEGVCLRIWPIPIKYVV